MLFENECAGQTAKTRTHDRPGPKKRFGTAARVGPILYFSKCCGVHLENGGNNPRLAISCERSVDRPGVWRRYFPARSSRPRTIAHEKPVWRRYRCEPGSRLAAGLNASRCQLSPGERLAG